MEPTSERRFDPNFAAQIVHGILHDFSVRVQPNVAQARSLGALWMRRHRAGEGVWL
jgi:hypothetical protein